MAVAPTTLGSFVGMATLADALDAAKLPDRVALAEARPPASPDAVIVTSVPGGTFTAVTTTATGLAVFAGNVTSGVEYEPVGDPGAAIPATEAMLRLGAFGRIAVLGRSSEGATVYVMVEVSVNASTRTRPSPPAPPPTLQPEPALPPATLIEPPAPEIKGWQ